MLYCPLRKVKKKVKIIGLVRDVVWDTVCDGAWCVRTQYFGHAKKSLFACVVDKNNIVRQGNLGNRWDQVAATSSRRCVGTGLWAHMIVRYWRGNALSAMSTCLRSYMTASWIWRYRDGDRCIQWCHHLHCMPCLGRYLAPQY